MEKSNSFEIYKNNLEKNDERIRWYLYFNSVMNELDGISNKSSLPNYKNKTHEEIVEWCMNNFRFKRGLLITIHVPSYLTFGRFSKTSERLVQRNPDDYFFQIEQLLTRFYRRLERRVSKGGSYRLEKFSVIEGCYSKTKRNHIHTLVEVPEHLSVKDFSWMIYKSHGSIHKNERITENILGINPGYGFLGKNYLSPKNKVPIPSNLNCLKKWFELGRIDIRELDTFGRQKLYTYLTKECKEDRYTVSWKNTYERSLRYLLREKRVKQERKKWIPHSKCQIKIKPTLEPWMREKEFNYENDMDWKGLNEWVVRKNSSVSRFKKINEMLTNLDLPV